MSLAFKLLEDMVYLIMLWLLSCQGNIYKEEKEMKIKCKLCKATELECVYKEGYFRFDCDRCGVHFYITPENYLKKNLKNFRKHLKL